MIRSDVTIGKGTKVYHRDQVNIFGCIIGSNCKIHSFVVIQADVTIGNNVKIEPFTFIPSGVTIEDDVFIGPHVCFTNDRYPRATNGGALKGKNDWKMERTVVKKGASIGAGSIIRCGVTIEEGAMIGAGSVVVHDVRKNETVVGNPARTIKKKTRK